MGKTKTSNEVADETVSAPFELILPSDIAIEPWHEVELPRNKKAMVYRVTCFTKEMAVQQLRYDVYIVSRKSLRTTNELYNSGRGVQFQDLPALKHYLYDAVAQLSIRKTTRKIVNVQDLTEVDDE